MSRQQTKNCITLRGSAQIICEYLKFAINSVLFQRGLYPPETFKAEQQYGITLLISEDAQIKDFLKNLLTQSEEWIVNKKVSKLSLIILNVANKEVLECWDFNVQYEQGDLELSKEKKETVGSKELKKIQQEIRDVMLQVAATVSYLPLLDCRCSFDVLVHAKTDCDIPDKWSEAEPVAIANAQNVHLKSFSTSLHKMETVVAATVSYLPLLDCRCSFDVLVHAKTDCDIPDKWSEAEPVAIANAQNVHLKSFSTSLHKMETVVSYKLMD